MGGREGEGRGGLKIKFFLSSGGRYSRVRGKGERGGERGQGGGDWRKRNARLEKGGRREERLGFVEERENGGGMGW